MLRSLVGSEMCIRDRFDMATLNAINDKMMELVFRQGGRIDAIFFCPCTACLLYTSDAADDPLCVDLGGRRIIKKTIINLSSTL